MFGMASNGSGLGVSVRAPSGDTRLGALPAGALTHGTRRGGDSLREDCVSNEVTLG